MKIIRTSQRARSSTLLIVCLAGLAIFLLTEVVVLFADWTVDGHVDPDPLCDFARIILEKPETGTRHTEHFSCPLGYAVCDGYCVLTSYVDDHSVADTATLCTLDFLWPHVSEQCNRWQGPISLAIYAPDTSLRRARQLVDAARSCDPCVRRWVQFHLYFDAHRAPKDFSELPWNGDCDFRDVDRNFSGNYPINVGRNIARTKAITPFVLSIDIELYPSLSAIPRFRKLMSHWDTAGYKDEVWVLPVFEVYPEYQAPSTKRALREMFFRTQDISFHVSKCSECHHIPFITRWFDDVQEVEDNDRALRVWTTLKRNKHFGLFKWKTFFFGTNRDPLYDPRFSWQSKGNKMIMAYEMCLRNYDYHILDEAFLVHAPDVKIYNLNQDIKSNKQDTFLLMCELRMQLREKYGGHKGC